MCGTAKTPPPPPDYSSQKNAYAQQQSAAYKGQADRYNAATSAFNNALNGLGSQISSGKSQFGNLTIANGDKIGQAYDFWSGLKNSASQQQTIHLPGIGASSYTIPGQTPNLSGLSLGGLIGGTLDTSPYQPSTGTTPGTPGDDFSFSLSNFNLSAPNFSSIVTTPYNNETVSLQIPNLINPNSDLARNYLSDIDSQLAQISNLKQQREAEQARIGQYKTQYEGSLNSLLNREKQLSIGDLAGINSLEGELNSLETQRRGFSTALAPEYADLFGQTSYTPLYGQITSGLTDLRNQRNTEDQRIKAYEQDMLGLFDSTRNQLSNLSIADIDKIKALDAQIDDRARDARRFQSPLSYDFGQEFDAYNEVNNRIDQLYGQRTAEESRVKNEEASLLQRANQLQQQAQRVGITNPDLFQQLTDQANALRNEATGFTSPISFDFSQELAPLTAADQEIAAAQTKRSTEQARIDAFRQQLNDQLSSYKTQLGGLTIADLDKIKAIDSGLTGLNDQARNFTAELPVDFSSLYNSYGDLDRQIGDLYTQRSQEEQRVNSAKSALADRASGLLRSATLSDYYDANNLDAMASDIAKARQTATGFSSALGPVDFGASLDDLTNAEAKIAALRGQRTSALGDFMTRGQGLNTDIAGLNLYDEDLLRADLGKASSGLGDLSMFRGSDVDAVRKAFSDALNLGNDRLTQLGVRRNDIENRAKTLMGQVRDTSYNTTDQIDAAAAQQRALEDEMNLYKANQASDELSFITNRFGSERDRIAADNTKRQQIEAQERQQAQQMLDGNAIVNLIRNRRYDTFTDDDYQRLLAATGAAASPFSRSLGLA